MIVRRLKRLLDSLDRDDAIMVIGMTGLGLFSWGCWQIWHPLGPIAAGALLLTFFVSLNWRASR